MYTVQDCRGQLDPAWGHLDQACWTKGRSEMRGNEGSGRRSCKAVRVPSTAAHHLSLWSVAWCADQPLHLNTQGWNWQGDRNSFHFPPTPISVLIIYLGSNHWCIIWIFFYVWFCLLDYFAFRANNPWQMRKKKRQIKAWREGGNSRAKGWINSVLSQMGFLLRTEILRCPALWWTVSPHDLSELLAPSCPLQWKSSCSERAPWPPQKPGGVLGAWHPVWKHFSSVPTCCKEFVSSSNHHDVM